MHDDSTEGKHRPRHKGHGRGPGRGGRRAMHGEACAGYDAPGEVIDELLESLWIMDERGKADPAERSALSAMAVDEGHVDDPDMMDAVLGCMAGKEYIRLNDEEVSFRKKGREKARELIRRKRLAEKLLAEVLAVGPSETRVTACHFEHVLSPEVTESVCSFLGHPPRCPHGKPIPQGECCKRLSHGVKPLVMPMSDLNPGDSGRIVFISPRDHSRMDRLSSLGIVPGTEVRLHQKTPAFVIRTGETELALDVEIAGEIYVKQVG